MRLRKMSALAAAGALVLSAATGIVGATAANAACTSGHYCGYNDEGYGGGAIIDTTYKGTGLIDMPDVKLSSAQNRVSGSYYGCYLVLPNVYQLVFTFAPTTNYSTLGGANDRVVHMYYGKNRC